MASPLIRAAAGSPALLLSPCCLPPAAWYAVLAAHPRVVVDAGLRHDKRRKEMHRYEIADTRGRLRLTVPVSRPDGIEGTLRWADMRVSTHARWWDVHRVAWESAYGRTPYFEFYIDRFAPLFDNDTRSAGMEPVVEFNRRADEIVRQILGIDSHVEWRVPRPGEEFKDLRRLTPEAVATPAHWQVRADRLGFIGGLSVLDLIFNLGPEAPLHLLQYDITDFL